MFLSMFINVNNFI